MSDENQFVTGIEFDRFVINDFEHLKEKVGKIDKAVSFIKGQLVILIPLILVILGMTGTILFKLIGE